MTSAESAYLELLVEAQPGSNMRRFDLTLNSPFPALGLNYRPMGTLSLLSEPSEFFRQHLLEIAQGTASTFAEDLNAKGAYLSERILPEGLRRLLAELQGKVRTLLVQSDDPWIPWELLRLPEAPDSEAADGPFLCEAFAMTRWLKGTPQIEQLPLRQIAVVVPQNSGLAEAPGECEDMLALGAGKDRSVERIPARFAPVWEAFGRGYYDGWHFAGHGFYHDSTPDLSFIGLENNEKLTPAHLSGKGKRIGEKHPLIFLNACSTGQAGIALTELGGWVPQFLRAGTGACIGALWSIDDGLARKFARAFYSSFLAGIPIAEAVFAARQTIRSEEDATWLAYTVFAHPMARCAPAPESAPAKPSAALPPLPPIHVETPEPPAPAPSTPRGPSPGEERVHEEDGTVLVYVPGGEFTLGAEGLDPWSRPVHRVRLSPFWIGKVPVTNEQYARFLEENPESREPAFWKDPRLNPPRHPVVGVSWEEAQAYCRWAGLELPTEAQWEAAARGTDQRPYPWGRKLPTPAHANFGGERGATTPVGAYPAGAGPYGTLDQAGNVWEWCADPWSSTAYRELEDGQWDPLARGETAVRVLRGGSFQDPVDVLHAAYRDRGTAANRVKTQGFRCVWRSS